MFEREYWDHHMNQPQKKMEGSKDPSTMTDLEFSQWVTERMMGGWVPLQQYLRCYPEETQAKIDTRIARGVWTRGIHFSVPRKSRAWVNLPAIRAWIEAGSPETGPEAGD